MLIFTSYRLFTNFREVCKNEFIIPLGPELKVLYSDNEMCHSLRSLQMESIRPEMRMTEIAYVGFIFPCLCIFY